MRQGRIFAIFGPSGSGKNTLIEAVAAWPEGAGLRQIPTATTRRPRAGEVAGLHHHFITDADFDRFLAEGRFLEWQPIHGNRYGMLREVVAEAIRDADTICDVDIHGVRALYAAFPENVVRIFLQPPSLAVLRQRILGRGEIDPDELERRLRRAEEELESIGEGDYDYRVLNDELAVAIEDLRRIVAAERRFRVEPSGADPS